MLERKQQDQYHDRWSWRRRPAEDGAAATSVVASLTPLRAQLRSRSRSRDASRSRGRPRVGFHRVSESNKPATSRRVQAEAEVPRLRSRSRGNHVHVRRSHRCRHDDGHSGEECHDGSRRVKQLVRSPQPSRFDEAPSIRQSPKLVELDGAPSVVQSVTLSVGPTSAPSLPRDPLGKRVSATPPPQVPSARLVLASVPKRGLAKPRSAVKLARVPSAPPASGPPPLRLPSERIGIPAGPVLAASASSQLGVASRPCDAHALGLTFASTCEQVTSGDTCKGGDGAFAHEAITKAVAGDPFGCVGDVWRLL